jgi:hypothetical protein
MQNTEQSLKTLPERENRRNWLEIAEYLSIFGSAVGTLAGAISQQFVLAAAPLTVAVSLNLINRSRLAQQQQLASPEPSNAEAVTSSFEELFPFTPTPELLESATNLEEEIAQIKSSIAQLQDNTALVIQELREDFSQHKPNSSSMDSMDFLAMQKTLSQFQSKMERLEKNTVQEEDWAHINVQFLLIQEAIAELRTVTNQLQQTERVLEPQHESLSMPAVDQTSLRFEELNQRIEQLEQKNRDIVKPYLQRLIAEVKKLKKDAQLKI